MAEDNQLRPLAPAADYGRSDEESAAPPNQLNLYRQRQDHHSSKWLVYVLEAIVVTSAVLLIFSSIFMRVATPSAKLNSVTVENLRHDNSSLTMTMNGVVRIKNTNFGRFVLDSGKTTAIVMYADVEVGQGGVDGGRVRARDTEMVGVTMEVKSSGVLDTNKSRDLSSDIGLGILEMRSYANFSGRVYLMYDFIKKKETTELNCTMNLNLTSKAIQDLVCD